MNKQYTTEEITRRLKAGESITSLINDNYFSKGVNYNDYKYHGGGFLLINLSCRIYTLDVRLFNRDFMFTSDYEKMKSEEKGMEAAYKTIQEEKKLPFVNLGASTLIEKNEIPEWLQRERVAHWSRSYISCQSPIPEECFEYANKDLKQFDKRFLNNNDGK